jgi:hypothetical protein
MLAAETVAGKRTSGGSVGQIYDRTLHVGEIAFTANAADEMVDHDTMHPRCEIRAWGKAILGHQGFGCNILGQIVAIPGQGECPDTHFRHF